MNILVIGAGGVGIGLATSVASRGAEMSQSMHVAKPQKQ